MKEDPRDFREIRDNIMIIKGRFKAPSLNLYGQMILIFKNQNNFDSYNAVVSTYSDLYSIEPHEDWTKYREYIANVKWRGNFNATMTSSIMDQFKKFSEEMNSISLLYSHVCDYDYNAMDVILFDLVNRIVHEKNLILETVIQEVTPAEFKSALEGTDRTGEGGAAETAPADEGFGVEDDAVILPVRPIVAPVKGKPVYELRIGDRLLVYIQPSSERANHFIDLLKLRDDKELKPTAGEVIDIKGGSGKKNPTEILTLISAGIYGKFTETEKQVKLKMYDPLTDGPMVKRPAERADRKGTAGGSGPRFTRGTIIMMAFLAIILILFIVLIFLSW